MVREEIASGEGSAREFKSSLRWNIKAAKNDDAITLDAMKAIAAFLNSDGGVLFIGVTDDGALHGIRSDGFRNDDQFLVALYGYARQALGAEAAPYVRATTHTLDGTTIARVEVVQSPKPVFLTFGAEKDAVFIRTGPVTMRLPGSKVHLYIGEHWKYAQAIAQPQFDRNARRAEDKPFFVLNGNSTSGGVLDLQLRNEGAPVTCLDFQSTTDACHVRAWNPRSLPKGELLRGTVDLSMAAPRRYVFTMRVRDRSDLERIFEIRLDLRPSPAGFDVFEIE